MNVCALIFMVMLHNNVEGILTAADLEHVKKQHFLFIYVSQVAQLHTFINSIA